MGGTRLKSITDGGHVIEDEGTPLPQQAELNFVGAGVVASDAVDTTNVTIPAAAGGGPQSINPIDIAVNLKHKWLHDDLFYSSFSNFLEYGYLQVGVTTPSFNLAGFVQFTTAGGIPGRLSSIVTLRNFELASPLLVSDIFFRALVTNRDVGTPTSLTYVGLMQGDANGEIAITGALDDLLDSVAFLVSEGGFPNKNWHVMTQIGTSRTVTDTGVTSDNIQRELEARSIAGGDIEFLIDGVVVATHSTNVPAGSLIPFRCGALDMSNGPAQIRLSGFTIATTKTE